MNLYRLERLYLKKYKRSVLNQTPETKSLCNMVLVAAESEARARELASKPMPKYGQEVAANNTIDIPCAWAYDVEPHIWADPALTRCTLVPEAQTLDKEEVRLRDFGEVPR